MTPGAGPSAGGERADLRARLVSQGRERLRGDAGAGRREPKGEEGVRWAARLGCWRGSGSGRGEVGREERLGRGNARLAGCEGGGARGDGPKGRGVWAGLGGLPGWFGLGSSFLLFYS